MGQDHETTENIVMPMILVVLDKLYTIYSKYEHDVIMSSSNYTERTQKEKVSGHAYKILKKLDCDKAVREETMTLIERADDQGLLAKGTPKGLAAGVVYIACILREDRMTLDTIGHVVGLSGSTVRKNYMILAKGLGFGER
jgi:transcription initiation factor TFIIIB Brf1 subunit/transcription initiation factor TFIIB